MTWCLAVIRSISSAHYLIKLFTLKSLFQLAEELLTTLELNVNFYITMIPIGCS